MLEEDEKRKNEFRAIIKDMSEDEVARELKQRMWEIQMLANRAREPLGLRVAFWVSSTTHLPSVEITKTL